MSLWKREKIQEVLRPGLIKSIWKRDLIPLIYGALSALPYLYFGLAPLAWISLVPLLVRIDKKTPAQAVRDCFIFGLGFWLVSIYWMNFVTLFGYLVLACYLSAILALWGGALGLLRARPGWKWWAAAIFWTGLEYFRSIFLGGFPWNQVGSTQAYLPVFIQSAAWLGVYGVSFFIVLVNGAVARLLMAKGSWPFRVWPLALVIAGGIVLVVGGTVRLKKSEAILAQSPRLSIALVQGGIRQEIKWDRRFAHDIFERYLELSRQALLLDPDLVIWPESSIPWYLDEVPPIKNRISQLARETRTAFVIGADYRGAEPESYFNSAFHVDENGSFQTRYDKLHLVPFGEYVPLGDYFPFLRRAVPSVQDFSPGRSPVLMPLNSTLQAGVLICFEDTLDVLARTLVARGAGILLNLTNDAWFGISPQPYQHVAGAIFRSVENRVSLARATNTGYSCLVDPWGRVIGEVRDVSGRALFASAMGIVKAPLVEPGTFFTRYGDVFAQLCSFLGAVIALLALFSRQDARERSR